jgi:hypothetical protein
MTVHYQESFDYGLVYEFAGKRMRTSVVAVGKIGVTQARKALRDATVEWPDVSLWATHQFIEQKRS